MARRSSSKSNSSKTSRPQGRRAITISSPNLRLHPLPVRLVSPSPFVGYDVTKGKKLSLFEDRRAFHPNKFARPAVSLGRRADTKLVVPSPLKNVQRLTPSVKFHRPNRIAICIRRAIRKEVIHALGFGGSKFLRKPKRNQFSEVKC